MMSAVTRYGRNAEIIVHCGDGTRGEALHLIQNCADKTVICVRGNCDFGSMLKDTEYINVLDKKIMITHGHLYDVKFTLDKLSYKAEQENCDIVFFGHTHNPADVRMGSVRMINPGSCGKYNPSCATVEIDKNGNVLVNHLEI